MAFLPDDPAALPAPSDAWPAALAEVVRLVGDKLGAALAHTSRSGALESRRRIELVLGRKLEPLFALDLVTLLLTQGREARELRDAITRLLSMAESPQWAHSLMRGAPPASISEDESSFLASDEAACLQEFARCCECLARAAAECEGQPLPREEAASLRWAQCAQCRCGTAEWYRR